MGLMSTLHVSASDVQDPWYFTHDGHTLATLNIGDLPVMFSGGIHEQILALSALIDSLTKARTHLQAEHAQGWVEDIEANPPFLAAISESELRALDIPESEARALAGDR